MLEKLSQEGARKKIKPSGEKDHHQPSGHGQQGQTGTLAQFSTPRGYAWRPGRQSTRLMPTSLLIPPYPTPMPGQAPRYSPHTSKLRLQQVELRYLARLTAGSWLPQRIEGHTHVA